jgi:hypothetical protein
MNIYNYDPITKELLSVEEADISPLEPDVYLFPANSTIVTVPTTELEEYKTLCFNIETKQWSIVDDYREVKLYSKKTKDIVLAALGQTLEELNATPLRPTGDYDSWDELTQTWIYNSDLETFEVKILVDSKIKTLIQEATDKIQILNDAYELGITTDKEKTKLTEWKTYRILLSRVSDQETYPLVVEYPSAPE